jgi:predicted nucleotidyltransferase
VLTWPDAKTVIEALKQWAEKVASRRPDVLRVGFFGSYARGDWGVGSDLDLLIIVAASQQPFEQRASAFDTLSLPVPADILVYTEEEWQAMRQQKRFLPKIENEVVWVYTRNVESHEANP